MDNALQHKNAGKKGLGAVLTALGVLLVKFKSILILILGKLKFLAVILKFGKFFGTLSSMFLMMWVYAMELGWLYAGGFVALLAAHEFGHLAAAKKENLKTGLPIFIPFVGAFISLKEHPTDARTEAIVAAGGPVVGSLAALLCLVAGIMLDSKLLLALAYTGFFLNLFNLIPVSPLDGGRMAGAISPYMWLVGIPILGFVAWKFFNPILMIFLIMGVFQAFHTWKSPDNAYYAVSGNTRLLFACVYFGLMLVLGMGMIYVHGLHAAQV
jgi:Zn-dependent protease